MFSLLKNGCNFVPKIKMKYNMLKPHFITTSKVLA